MALYGYTAYSASKYAVRGLAEVLDMELKVHNIRVSVSFPPDTDTPMLQVRPILYIHYIQVYIPLADITRILCMFKLINLFLMCFCKDK